MSTQSGRAPLRLPVFGPDQTDPTSSAASGLRGPLRFVRSANGIGVYSTQPRLRARRTNPGAIVKIDDTGRTYRISTGELRTGTSKKDNKFGPLLPSSPAPSTGGTHTVTASITPTQHSTRDQYLQFLLSIPHNKPPMRLPSFWNFRHRYANWLVDDTRPVFYDISGNVSSAYCELGDAAKSLRQRGGTYIDHAERAIFGAESFKGNAGAGKLMDRQLMEVGTSIALHFHFNFEPVCFTHTGGIIYFMPDEMIVASAHGDCMLIPYRSVSYNITETTHLGVPVPSWCEPIGFTWQYMNKDGGPDRRYNENAQIFHYRVWELDFMLPSGRLDTAFADFPTLTRFIRALDRLIELNRNLGSQ